ncbi:MAG: hypothetical protein HYY04_04335 [Chloroflexi bacterium]|nr:hypothetical protein [Chloroflexota bacterium]
MRHRRHRADARRRLPVADWGAERAGHHLAGPAGDRTGARWRRLVPRSLPRAGRPRRLRPNGLPARAGLPGNDALLAPAHRPAPPVAGPRLFHTRRRGRTPHGGHPAADPTNAASSGLFDVQAGTWDRELVRRLGLLERLLPTVAPSGARAGVLQGDVARSIGLRGGTPVFVALGDNQASVLGSVREYEHTLIVNIGTGGQISARLEDCAFVPGLDTRPFPGGRYLLVGAGLTGGRSYAWLRDLFRAIGVAFFGARGDEDLYDAMTALAAAVPPGADGLCCEPLFTGSRRDPSRRGAFAGVGVANATPGHLARAVLEGMVEQFHQFFTSMAPVIGETRQLVGAGNGIRRNPVLAQILSRRFSLPLHRPVTTEQAATGAAMVAAVGCGTIGSLREAARYVRYEEVVEPE